ncbi:MAG: hypothetical protein DMD62_14870 [Gemmatimonadetes bacterium]|nr:MAG: hypothetical protein DMD62_14870 [Gemmatimonadota bacterium]
MNLFRGTLAVATVVLFATSCDLNVQNPNAPDRNRTLSTPEGLAQLLSGAFRAWVEARENYYVMPLDAQADNYTASWNNAAMRFYSSVGSDCPIRCGWTNSSTAPEAAGGPTVEALWYGYYTVLNSANSVMTGIVKDSVCFDQDCAADNTITTRNTAMAKMLQGMAFAGIAMVYDQGFFVDENTDLTNPSALPFSTRAELRDSAIVKFNEAYTIAAAGSWSTEADWMGVGQTQTYTAAQMAQLIRTMEAELIALWPRNGAENTAADWASVASYASQGISSTATPFSWEYFIDVNSRECGIDCIKNWGNSVSTERVDTRVAALLTTNHVDPWPAPSGNPCPTISSDKRVGDGTYGPPNNDNFDAVAIAPADAGAGTDYACAGVAIFPAARGSYHQSNLQHVRYHQLASRGEDLPADDGTGQDPMYTPQMNDLLWAEGLVRSGGDLALAAAKIDNSHVTRGGLPSTVGLGAPELITAIQYEQEIEFMGQGVDPFFNRRRSGYNAPAAGGRPAYVDGLITNTPRHMPVPAKELDILLRAVYTFGGPSSPDMSAAVEGGVKRETVEQRFRALENARPGYLTRFLPSDMRF